MERSLNIFRSKFITIMQNKGDNRLFQLLERGIKGSFTQFLSPSRDFCFACEHDHNNIEIYYDSVGIQKEYLEVGIINLEKVFSYLAYHEYGHSLFGTSNDLKRIWENTLSSGKLFQNYNGLSLANCFLDFFADFKAEKVGCRTPNTFLQKSLNWVRDYGIKHYYQALLPHKGFELIDSAIRETWLPGTLNNLRRFYIWNEWEQLIPIFEDFNIGAILEFLRIFFECFNHFCENHTNLTDTRDKLIALIDVIDKNQFDNLIIHKILTDDIGQLFGHFLE